MNDRNRHKTNSKYKYGEIKDYMSRNLKKISKYSRNKNVRDEIEGLEEMNDELCASNEGVNTKDDERTRVPEEDLTNLSKCTGSGVMHFGRKRPSREEMTSKMNGETGTERANGKMLAVIFDSLDASSRLPRPFTLLVKKFMLLVDGFELTFVVSLLMLPLDFLNKMFISLITVEYLQDKFFSSNSYKSRDSDFKIDPSIRHCDTGYKLINNLKDSSHLLDLNKRILLKLSNFVDRFVVLDVFSILKNTFKLCISSVKRMISVFFNVETFSPRYKYQSFVISLRFFSYIFTFFHSRLLSSFVDIPQISSNKRRSELQRVSSGGLKDMQKTLPSINKKLDCAKFQRIFLTVILNIYNYAQWCGDCKQFPIRFYNKITNLMLNLVIKWQQLYALIKCQFFNKPRISSDLRSVILLLLIICSRVNASPEALALRQDEEEDVLHIGGIFPINGEGGWQGGQACMPAAKLALEDVNKRKDLLPGYQLNLHSNDSECEPGLGASVMYNLLYNPPQKLLLLAGCSTVCTTVAEAAKMWNLMVLCYGASSPALSDRRRFPTLFRTHPSATVHNPTRIKLMKKFGWSRVAILQQAEEVFISTVEDLEARCKEAGIEIVTRQSFLSDPTDAVRNLRRQDARIIVGLFYVVAARRVLCDLYKQNLYGKSYVWFFIGWYEDNWFEVNLEKEGIECTAVQMRAAAEGHLTTEALMWNQNRHQPTISGMTAEDFSLRLNAALRDEGYDIDKGRYPEGYQEAPLAYDAVWAVALALNKTMERLARSGRSVSLKNFTYTDKEIADDIYAAINSTSFLGVSGTVAFSSQGDRIALTQIEQMIDGEYVKLGYYDTQADNLSWLNKEKWAGGKVPQDRTIIRRELRLVSLPLYACISAVAIAGMCVAVGLIVFNIWNSHRRVIQSSHPVCNTIMLVGCVLCLAGLLVLGADGRVVAPDGFPALCQARLWLLSIGFTLAYGAMFSKVWRVHRFTTKAKVDPKKKVEPWKLYTMVSGLLLIDIVILLAWSLKDPLLRRIEQFPLEEPPSALDDSKIRPELEHCESDHNAIWLGAIYGYKGLVLVFGLFLAYETRSVKLRQINDSRYVGMSIYNVVVLCLITAPVSLVVSSQQDANFAFVSLAVIFCCFLSMALIFVPKVIEVIRHPKDRAESKYNPDAGQSREDEEKYHKLLTENDQLQQLITSKEEKIRSLKQKLAEKEGQQGKTTIVTGISVGITNNKDGQHTITQDVEEEHI